MCALRLLSIAITGFLFVGSISCKRPEAAAEKDKPSGRQLEPHTQDKEMPDVVFDLKSNTGFSGARESQSYDCTYHAGGKTAKFRLQFTQKGPMKGDFPLGTADGSFLAIAGSDNSVLMQDLKKALDAKHVPEKPSRIAELPFTAVILGKNQSRGDKGGFFSSPPGDWMAMKIFLPKNGDDGEVFLNLNPVLGKGEFSIKDSDYGDYLLNQFAQVL